MFSFTATHTHGSARRGVLTTPHGQVQTPAFMPVGTQGAVKAVTHRDLLEAGAEIILANTYHLYLRPGAERIGRMGGLHAFIGWEKPILTDSGGYQVFSLADRRKVHEDGATFRSHLDGSEHVLTPESAVDIQGRLGSDIAMVLDECLEHPASQDRARDSLERTLRWARRGRDRFLSLRDRAQGSSPVATGRVDDIASVAQDFSPVDTASSVAHDAASVAQDTASVAQDTASVAQDFSPVFTNPGQAQFGIIQGGTYLDLRRRSVEETVAIGFEAYAIGGLSVGEPVSLMYDIAEQTAGLLPVDRPRYLMGVGTPVDLVECVARGIDMFDCVLPTRNARNGQLFTSLGRLNIKNAEYAEDTRPPDPACGCYTCRHFSRAYLRHLFQAGEMTAGTLNTLHNLYFYLDTMRRIREAIVFSTLEDLRQDYRRIFPA